MKRDNAAIETVYFLVLAGGAFRGAVQYWVIYHLLGLYAYLAIYGTSVGSINGVMAAMRKMDELLAFWNEIDGLKGYLRFRWGYMLGWLTGINQVLKWLGFEIIGGIYDMAPLVEKLTAFVRLDDVQTPFVAGVVCMNTGHYLNLDTRKMHDDQRAVLAIQASSCMVPYMQPPKIALVEEGGELYTGKELGIDGGYRNIFPFPGEEIAAARAEGKRVVVHAIGCTPLERIHKVENSEVDGLIEMGIRGVDILEAEVYSGDLLQLREAVGPEGEVCLWVPSYDTGPSFDASRETIQARLKEGKAMVEAGPIVLSGLEARDG